MIQQDPEEIKQGIKRFSQQWLDNRVKHVSDDLADMALPHLIEAICDNSPEQFMDILKKTIGGAFRSGLVGTCMFILEMGSDITPIKETKEYKEGLNLPYMKGTTNEEEQNFAD